MNGAPRSSWGRTRWAAIGAAVAVALGAGGIGISNATISSGEKAAFVPITPCRLFDTRTTSPVGPRTSPLGVGETYTQTVWGANGNCTIPADATAVAMNVTAVGGTAASFLTIWPSDVARPLASSLNWVAGSPPTPNKVDVRLSADGKINLFNNLGSVDVLADVVGYYADHNHDDRYYTKAQVDTKIPTAGSVVISHPAFVTDASGGTVFVNGCIQSSNNGVLEASVEMPVGVTITGFKAWVIDGSAGFDLTVSLIRLTTIPTPIATVSSSGVTGGLVTLTATAATPEHVDSGEYYFLRFTPSNGFASTDICGVEVLYNNPA